jgi:hypothetical protein
MRIAFRLATIARSLDMGHLPSDRMAMEKRHLVSRIAGLRC